MKKFITFILSLLVLIANSQNVELTGTAIGHPDELVRMITYKDQFSRMDTTWASTRTDIWGNFSLSVTVDKTNYTFLASGLKRGNFYLEPGNSYHFQILEDTIKGSIYDQMPLQFNLTTEDDTLNRLVGLFNYEYNVFIYENQRLIMRAKDKSIIHNFVAEMKIKYVPENLSSVYLKEYVEYALASLEWISKSKPDSLILEEYFVNREVLYENIAYSDFFRDFFKEYLNTQKKYSYDALVHAISSQEMAKVDSLLLKDELLTQDGDLRELVLISLLARNFYNKDIAKEDILILLSQIQHSANRLENRRVAKNYIDKLTQLQYGSMAPSWQLFDQDNKIIQLKDLKGKFVLLNFISSTCNPCLFDFQKLDEIQKSLGNQLIIVTITTDDNLERIVEFKAKNNFNWTVLKLDENILLLETYEVKTYPAYILINPDATIALAPAPSPKENLEGYIRGFMARYQNKK